MSEIKIRVSTHDHDTTDIDLSRNGTKLKVSLGDKKAEIDIAEFVPATMADRFLSDATYDENTKEFVFTTRKEGEEDTVFRVPVAEVFKTNIEIEEVLSVEKDNLSTSLYLNFDDGGENVGQSAVSAIGHIKGTDWYVLKFDGQIDEWIAKRDAPKPELKTFDPQSSGLDNGANVFNWKSLFSTKLNECSGDITLRNEPIEFLDFRDAAKSETFKQDTLPESLIVYHRDSNTGVENKEWVFTAVKENGIAKRYAPPADLPFVATNVIDGIEFKLDVVINGTRTTTNASAGTHTISTPRCAEIEDNEE